MRLKWGAQLRHTKKRRCEHQSIGRAKGRWVAPRRRKSRRRTMRARRTNLAFGALLAISGLLAPAAAQDKPVDLKLSHWVPPTHPLQKAMEAWGNSVKVASGGSISFAVFPAQ